MFGPTVEDMFEAIFAFEKDNPGKISMGFVNSVHTFWLEKAFISQKQQEALENIYNGFKLGEDK
jgi:hypothetical protein